MRTLQVGSRNPIRKGARSPGSGIRSGCLAASGLPCPESQHVSPIDEDLWHELMTSQRELWEGRARDPSRNASQLRYAFRRARRLNSPYSARLASCAKAGVVVKCACPGKRSVRWYSCRSHLVCRDCQRGRSKRMRAKIHAALEARIVEAPRGHQLVMMTISVAHTGDIGADRQSMMDGWRAFRKAYHRRWGRFVFVGTHEITPGDDQLGHPHAHVVCIWPVGRPGDGTAGDWQLLSEMWREACPESSRVSFSASRSAKNAARYVSKYVSKGVQTIDFSKEMRSRVLAGTYNTRWIFTSRAAWVPFQPCCRDCGEAVHRATFKFHGCSDYQWIPPHPDWYETDQYQYRLAILDIPSIV